VHDVLANAHEKRFLWAFALPDRELEPWAKSPQAQVVVMLKNRLRLCVLSIEQMGIGSVCDHRAAFFCESKRFSQNSSKKA
jgi:hypothetical protein